MMRIRLVQSPAQTEWGEQALFSFDGACVLIHVLQDKKTWPRAAQRAARQLNIQGIYQAQLQGAWTPEAQWAFAQGFSDPKRETHVQWAPCEEVDHRELETRSACYRWLREVTHAPPSEFTPLALAVEAASFLTEIAPNHISHRILQGEALKEKGWTGIYNVGRGSHTPPVLLEVDFNPTRDPNMPVSACVVGKGITFDSGGYSLKQPPAMASMKSDMGGAATVTAGLALAMYRGLNTRVKLYLCCAENLVSGQAYKPGDILRYKNGTTVEILNTDAEGRLVLADGLLAASETGASFILDAATLTGAAYSALGGNYNGLFAVDDALRHRFEHYAKVEHEAAWSLPLEMWHQNMCPSHYADTANSIATPGGGPGAASNAAGFLSRFVSDLQGWIHIDLAASFKETASSLWPAGATGVGIRTIAHALLKETRQ